MEPPAEPARKRRRPSQPLGAQGDSQGFHAQPSEQQAASQLACDGGGDGSSPPPSRVLLPELLLRYAAALHSNDVACGLRLINKAAAATLAAPEHTTVHLSEPVPHPEFRWKWTRPVLLDSLPYGTQFTLEQLVARSGSFENLDFLTSGRSDGHKAELLKEAAMGGRLELVRCLHERGVSFDQGGALWRAAKGGHAAVCEWLLAAGCPFHAGAPMYAAKEGHVALMDWLLEYAASHGATVFGPALLARAATGCDLPTLQRLHAAYTPERQTIKPLADNAAGSPTADWKEKVAWLEGMDGPTPRRTERACIKALQQSDACSRLLFLQQRGYPLQSINALERAVEVGNAEAVQLFLAAGTPMYGVFTSAHILAISAACRGYLDVLRVLHGAGAPIDTEVLECAASAGHVAVVAWLVEQLSASQQPRAKRRARLPPVLTSRIFLMAAASGKIELLEWLLEHGCPWDVDAFAAPIEVRSLHMERTLTWLAEHGCPMQDSYLYEIAAGCNPAALSCLRRLGCPMEPDGSTHAAILARCLRTCPRGLRFLLGDGWEEGLDWDAAARHVSRSASLTKQLRQLQQERNPQAWLRGGRLRACSKPKLQEASGATQSKG